MIRGQGSLPVPEQGYVPAGADFFLGLKISVAVPK